MWHIDICNEETKLRNTKCSSDKEIDDWLIGKIAIFKVLNNQLHLHDFNSNNLEIIEKWLRGIKLKRNLLTDTGWRFRRNEFRAYDSYWGFGSKKKVYYDFKFFNFDIYNTKNYDYSNKEYEELKYRLCDAWFRIDSVENIH